MTAVPIDEAFPFGLSGVDALAADGGIVRIRPVTPADSGSLTAMYQRGSPDNLRMRFFAVPGRRVLLSEVARLCRPMTNDHGALLAEQAGELIGVASYERSPDNDRRAEFAVFVDEAHHGRGIGTLLLEHLFPLARLHGLTELVGEVMPSNTAMLRLATDLSGRVWSRLDDGVVDVGLITHECDDIQAAVDARERAAQRASLRPLFAPRAVAVVGAGRASGGIGHETLRSMIEYGFTGVLYAVNPHAEFVAGVTAYRSLRDVPGPVDLAVIAVPAKALPGVLADAAVAGVRAAVVLSSGFAGTRASGRAARAARAELVRKARANGIRLVGPNCLGVFNTDPKVRLAATVAPRLPATGSPTAGRLAVAAQSGGVGVAVVDHAIRANIGISSFVSMGDKADVSGNDLLAYWFDDPATQAVALHLESFANPRKFARLAQTLARRKPVLALFSGRPAAGHRADTVPLATVHALFDQAGVIRADHLGELLDAARMVTGQPLPAGHRLAIVGDASGVDVLAANVAEATGLVLPELSAALRKRLAKALPDAAGVANPIDLGAGATPAMFARALGLVAAGGEADAVLVAAAVARVHDVPATLDALAHVVDRWGELPIAVVVLGEPTAAKTVGSRRVPVFDLPEQAVRAIAKAADYAAWLREPIGRLPDLPDVDAAAARAVVSETMAVGGDGWQPLAQVSAILSAYGISLRPESPTAPEAIAEEGTLELVAGAEHDKLFGSLVMLGAGGRPGRLSGDRALRLAPLTDLDARRMWQSLRVARLMTGDRGEPAVDTTAVEDLLLRLGRLAEELPEVAELVLDPVLVGPAGLVTVRARLRLAPVGPEPDAGLRQLRGPA